MRKFTKLIIRLSLVFYVVFNSCNYIGKSDRISYRNAQKYLNEYHAVSDEKSKKILIHKAYQELHKNLNFTDKGLTIRNYQTVISILLYAKKYDELEKLLLQSRNIPNAYTNSFNLNYVKYLKYYRTNKNLAENYIKNNITITREKITKTPQDSALYNDYFTMKALLNGKEKTLKEIDSMQKVNKHISKFFYKYVLKQTIEEMDYSFPK